MKPTLFLFLFLFSLTSAQAGNYPISGFVQDFASGERLVGASVFCPQSKNGTTTNSYGFFRLFASDSSATLAVVRFVGYETLSIYLKPGNPAPVTIELKPALTELDEVTISADEYRTAPLSGNQLTLPLEKIKSMPVLLGEQDLIKSLLTLPGVQFATEGTANVSIRGGSPDQNLILVDDVPVYNTNHLLGIFSIFNTDALKSATFIKGGFPARYGGRTSSVLDLRMKEGNLQEFHGTASIGIITSKVMVEGPIIKDRLSYMVTARRTFLDLLAKPVMALANIGKDEKRNFGYSFYDLTGKLNYIVNDNDRLYLSYFSSHDPLSIGATNRSDSNGESSLDKHRWTMKFGNRIASLRWNHLFPKGVFMNATLLYSAYKFSNSEYYKRETTINGDTKTESSDLGLSSGLNDFGGKIDFDINTRFKQRIRTGIESTFHKFEPGVEVFYFNDAVSTYNVDSTRRQELFRSFETAFYLDNEITLGKVLLLNLGYRLNLYRTANKTYINHEPRVSAKLSPAPGLTIETAYSGVSQNLHLLSNTGISLPTDLWVPVTDRIRPIYSRQKSIGISFEPRDKAYAITVEAYHKTLENVIEYKEGASFIDTTTTWEYKVEAGKGLSYGIELMAEKKTGWLQGWVSYTWSRSSRQFENISFGKEFPYKFDRPHNLSINTIIQLKKNRQLNLNWVFASGNPVTFAFENYTNNSYDFANLFQSDRNSSHANHSIRNNYRYPSYHRLDIAYTLSKTKKRYKSEWNFGIYNLYNKHNAFLIYSENKKLYQLSLLPIIPSIQYTIHF